jgi:amidase
MGSPIYKGYQPRADAACVAALKAAGAIVLGKTVTAEFAYVAPGPTRNPHNERHTPGGSSSGSAAAVADFMVPVALGTQTGGSVIRPASFCGIFGFKPTYGAFNRSGLKLAADSLDTIGLLTRSIEDIALFKNVLTEARPNGISLGKMTRPRIGLCRTHLWHKASPAAQMAVESAAKALSAAGAHVTDFELPAGFRDLDSGRTIINNVERARTGTWEWHNHRRLLSKQMVDCIESGLATSYNQYLDVIRLAERCRIELDLALQGIDALLTLSVSGEAPEGLSHTGDSTFQSLWTLLHVPSMTLPTSTGETNLPIGIQLIAPRFHDDQLLRVAEWAWTHLH